MFRSYDHHPGAYTKLLAYMPLDDGRMTEAFCGSNIEGGKEELLR
jgi:hypothetical protein